MKTSDLLVSLILKLFEFDEVAGAMLLRVSHLSSVNRLIYLTEDHSITCEFKLVINRLDLSDYQLLAVVFMQYTDISKLFSVLIDLSQESLVIFKFNLKILHY